MARPRVLLADDHLMVAEGLGRLLEGEVDLVATAIDGAQLVEQARQHRPDVIIADINMPVMNGLAAMKRLKADGIQARFIFVTLHNEPRLASEAMRAGASGYLLKYAAGDELIEAVRAVSRGLTYMTPLITRDVMRILAYPDATAASTPPQKPDEPGLRPRQLEILRLIVKGQRMKEIAAHLGLSTRTVDVTNTK